MKTKKVPQTWYNEEANSIARDCMDVWRKYGRDSKECKDALQKRAEWKAKYIPVKELKGNIQAAKLEIRLNFDKIYNAKSIKDKYECCNFVSLLADKYYLSGRQVENLLVFCIKRNLT